MKAADSTTRRTAPPQPHVSNAFEDRVVAYAEGVIRFRWWIMAATIASVMAAAVGGKNLGFSTDYRVFFSDENPQLAAYEALQKVYTQDDNIMLVIKPAEGDVFTPARLDALRKLTESAWKTPYATRVDSITNFQHSQAEGDDLTVRDLVDKKADLTPAMAAETRALALAEPLLVNRMISPDGTTTGININLTMPRKSLEEGPAAMAYARGLAEELRRNQPDLRVAITGLAALNNAFSEASLVDMQTLIPLMYGALLLVMVLLLRSFSGTVGTVLVIGFSALTAMGLTGWFGILLTPPSSTAPTIILTIAIADSVHILVTQLREMRLGASKRDAIIESLRINFAPVFLTTATTVIGFLSLNFSDAPPFRDLGNITAMGVTAAWVLSIAFLPALMAVLPMRIKVRAEAETTGMQRFAEWMIGRQRVLLWGMVVVVAGLAVMVPRIELNDRFVEYFDESIPFRTDTDFAMDNLSGIYQMQYSLPSGEEGGINNPDYLAAVDGFKAWFLNQPEVTHVQSLTDVMTRLNKNMHADDPAYYKLPEERDLAAQYLLLFEMSLPYGLDLNNQINVKKSATRIIVTLKNISTREARDLETRAGAWLDTHFPSAAGTHASGPFIMFAYISKRNIEGMLVGTAVALVLISGLLALALRSLKLGLISLVPNLVPAIMAFGLWSILVGTVDVAASIVTATSLGIVVDATVHFLSKYLRARRLRGETTADAVRYAFSTVGTALWVTSAILIAGFAVLSLSAFRINQELGMLTAMTLVCALAADFLLLPALLLKLDKDKTSAKETNDDNSPEPELIAAQ